MASSRRSPPAADPVTRAVARTLDACPAGAPVVVALSGGRDSMALAHAAAQAATALPALVAVHVHHGLSPNADAWAQACLDACHAWSIECVVQRVRIAKADPAGVEAAARRERYQALRRAAATLGSRAILLAHHQDDQAETVLLQLARGAGPRGLAAMPPVREEPGLAWHRPFLDLPRLAIDAYVRTHAIAHVEDESNAATDFRRNAVRNRIVPTWRETFGDGYPATLARVAALQAEAEELASELARIDARSHVRDRALDQAGLAALAPSRARNLLRHFLRDHGLVAPSQARLAAMLRQLASVRPDARVRLVHDGAELGVHRGLIRVHAPPPVAWRAEWQGEAALTLQHGSLAFRPATGEGIARARLGEGTWQVRPRQGGERFRPDAGRPRRALKSWLAEAGIPAWERDALPLVFFGERLAAVPGLGVDADFHASQGEPGLVPEWHPAR